MDLILRFENREDISCKILLYKGPRSRGLGKLVLNNQSILKDVNYGDVFCYKVYAEGYYTYKKAFIISEADIQHCEKWITLEFHKRSNNGYEADSVNYWTEEVERVLTSGEYEVEDIQDLDTPTFIKKKAMHEFTTTDECIQYLTRTGENNPNVRMYFLDKEKKIPVVVISKDCSESVDTLDGTIRILNNNSHLKVMLQAQIHGNEPAAGEAALYAVKMISQNKSMLEKMDVIIIPHVNPYGAEKFVRFSDENKMNLNRDSLILESETTRKLRKIYLHFMPEVFIDAHEFCGPFNGMFDEEDGNYLKMNDDIQVTCLNNLNRDQRIYELEKNIVKDTLEELIDYGFRCFCYRPTCDYSTSCGYVRLMSSFVFFIETNGIGRGKIHFRRRVISQIGAIKLLLSKAVECADEMRRIVAEARKNQPYNGEPGRRFVLKHEISENDTIWIRRLSYDFFGNVKGNTGKKEPYYNLNQAVKTMAYPRGYVLDKGESQAERVKQILVQNGATFEELPAGSKISVQKYKEWFGKKYWSEPKEIKFKSGAYIFHTSQLAANVILVSLEPEVEDMTSGNGIARPVDLFLQNSKKYPVYKMI